MQQIDARIDKIRSRLEEIETALSDNKVVRRAEAKTARTLKALEETRKTLKHAEQEVQAQRVKIEQNQAVLYGGKVRNPKELQDLQNEAEALKRYLSVLEDRQLEAMLQVDEAEGQHQNMLQHLKAHKTKASFKTLNWWLRKIVCFRSSNANPRNAR